MMPKSQLKSQVIFVGGVDEVQTTATYGNAAGKALAKEWHDYIGFVKDTTDGALGWVVVNHEMTTKNDSVGDGGGMTSFRIKRDKEGKLEVMNSTLPDGRSGKFFNVDFVNTVGETGMNCGGITANGRVWTAEEWMQNSNPGIYAGGNGFRDTTDWTITNSGLGANFDGKTLKRYQNLNWFVEVDPKTGKAIRKQYNWGRAGWEAGVVMPDNKTVYMFEDGTPGILGRFVATTAGDFTSGQMSVYKHDAPTKWIDIENNLDTLKVINQVAVRRGATMFVCLEWGALANGKVYFAETGSDNFNFNSGNSLNGVISPSLVDAYKQRYQFINGVAFAGTDADAADSVRKGKLKDYYGRVVEFDPSTNMVRSYIEGGPYKSSSTSDQLPYYPSKHLSNPDGMGTLTIGGKDYLMIQEDLNGTSYNRMPNGLTGTRCELYLLDASIANPTISDLERLTACAPGAEITGAFQIDSNTVLINSQHPSGSNTAPYNHSLTYAVYGFMPHTEDTTVGIGEVAPVVAKTFTIYPNPVARELHLSKIMDVAIYDMNGRRMKVYRQVNSVDVSDMAAGIYFIRNEEGETLKFIVE
jgi:secreted PhoX family phosphatase